MLQLHNVTFEYVCGLPLFEKVTLEVGPADKIGVAGPNGAGKSTLLRLMAGEVDSSAGQVIRRRGLRVAYVAQDGHLDRESPLSPGQRMRAALAEALASGAGLILMDEPTNHLDLSARQWLESQMLRSQAAFVVVSHDRTFLNAVCSRIVLVERGRAAVYAGNFDEYMAARTSGERAEWSEYERVRRKAAQERAAAERRIRLAVKVARRPEDEQRNPFYLAKSARVARTARLLRERSERGPEAEKPWEEQPIPDLSFRRVPRGPDYPVRLRDVGHAYGRKPLFAGVTLDLERGGRLVLRGPNGCGKTTLLRILLGHLQPAGGQVLTGAGVRSAWLAQEGENLDAGLTPLELCRRVCGGETEVRTMLACLRLPADKVLRPVSTLSAGERTKAGLAMLLLSDANLLLLDEPTNHLEMEARDALQAALVHYPGTVVMATHDDWLTEGLGARILEMNDTIAS